LNDNVPYAFHREPVAQLGIDDGDYPDSPSWTMSGRSFFPGGDESVENNKKTYSSNKE
jgi:hypothetical protein